MAIFRMGTVLVEAGSREVQGFDTSWLLSEVKGGILFFGNADGVIESVEAEDRLTLALPWPGRSGRGQYAIAMSTAQAASAVPAFERLNEILNSFRGLSMLGRQVASADTAEQMRRLLGVGTGNLKIDAAGTLAQRPAQDAQPAGFTYLATDQSAVYVRVGAAGWAGPYALAAGKDGREVQISQAGGYIIWRYAGETSWRNVVSLDALRGADGNDGLNVELRRSDAFVQWRVEGGEWANLIALDEIRGDAAESTIASIEAAARSEASAVRSKEDADRGEELRLANEAISATVEEDAARSRAAADEAAASQLASKASEDEAKASEIASKASEVAAKDSELAASASEIAAKGSETKSAASEVASKESETRSKASEIAAKGSEGNAAFSQDQASATAIAVGQVAEQVNAAKLAVDNNAAIASGAAVDAGESANRSEVASQTAKSYLDATEVSRIAAEAAEEGAKASEQASAGSAAASAESAGASAASAAEALASEQGSALSADRSAQEADRSDAGADRSIAAADRAEAADSSLHSLRRDNPHEVRIDQLYPMEFVGLDVPFKGYRGEYCGRLFVYSGANGFRLSQPANSGYGTLILSVEVVTAEGGLSEFSITIQIDVSGGEPRVDFTPSSGAVPAVYTDGFDLVVVPDFGPFGGSAANVLIRSATALDTLGYEIPDEELKRAVGQWSIVQLQSPPSGLAQVPPTYVVPPQPVPTLASVSEGTLSVSGGKALVGAEEVAGKDFVAGSVAAAVALLRDSVPAAYNTLKKLYDLLIEHTARTNNPHGVTASQVGLGNVQNLSPGGQVQAGVAAVDSLEIGQNQSGNRAAHVDLHASGAPGSLDYSARLIREPGANGELRLENTGAGRTVIGGTVMELRVGGRSIDLMDTGTGTVVNAGGYVDFTSGLRTNGQTVATERWVELELYDKQDALGFIPVQEGGGAGQSTNHKLRLGWASGANGNGTLKLDLENRTTGNRIDIGQIWLDWNSPKSFAPGTTTGSGYQILPSGLIIQWGTASISSAYVPFTIAFPNACLCVHAQNVAGPNVENVVRVVTLDQPSKTGVNIRHWDWSGSAFVMSQRNVSWLAIGY